MKRQDAEKIITEYLKPIFGFALKRCRSLQDAEDLSQEIVLRSFRALLGKDAVADAGRFIWTVAHNALSNYYRDAQKSAAGIPIDEIAERVADPAQELQLEDHTDSVRRMLYEIAYLTKLQRRIVVAYYFENKKQADIAEELKIPLGTVKWHLFEAKKELKRGMDTMRKTSELKFNPIKFDSYGINGADGTKSPDEFFRSALSQNICYCVRNKAKTVNEIADDLGVSPVYVEGEAEFLEEYGFLLAENGKYIINFIISEPTAELLIMQNNMYRQAAELFANDLYDELLSSGILEDPGILCSQTDEPVSLNGTSKSDRNFILWTLIPYIAAWSGEKLRDKRISFEEVATIRPDGGHNIYHATVVPGNLVLPDDYVYLNNWCGPMYNYDRQTDKMLWEIDSQWSSHGEAYYVRYHQDALRVLALYNEELTGMLSKADYVWLTERGYVKTNGDYDGHFKSAWQIVILDNREIQTKLLAVGDRLKEKYKDEFDALKSPYTKAVLDSVPTHLKKIKEYELQFVYHSDGWFLIHCIHALLNNGKLQLPTENQRRSLTTLIAPVMI